MNTETTQIILEVTLVLIGLYLACFKSYFQEKGKNIATREDIGEITRKIEIVKNEIHYSTQSKISLKVEERNALVNFYEKYHYWLNSIIEVDFNQIKESEKDEFGKIENRMKNAKLNYDLAEGQMEIFVRNNDLSSLLRGMSIKTLQLQHLIEIKGVELKRINSRLSWVRNGGNGTMHEVEQDATIEKLLEKKLDFFTAFYKEQREQCGEVLLIKNQFKDIVYEHLQGLLA